ncbi:hypothetical protein BGX34_000279, partial [Mortierella sp. NVP85]
MSAVPLFQNPCIAPAFGSSEVWLVGVPTSNDGRLDAYIVDLTNIDTPNVRFITTRIETNKWRANAQKACFPYGNSVNDPNSPIVLQQFGSQTWSTNVYPNGTIVNGILFGTYTFTSPKLFSLSASVDGVDWFSVLMEARSNLTNSPWVGLRLNAVTDLSLRGRVDSILSIYPNEKPLLSIGTFTPKPTPPSQGFNIVFDYSGGGVVYSAVGTHLNRNDTQDRALTLANPQNVDMSGISLTQGAIPVTISNVGYILDRASDGTTLVYSINPSRDLKLRRVNAKGNVIQFSSSMVASYLGNRIVVYSISLQGKAVFNTFDTDARVWDGPDLVKSSLPTYETPEDNVSSAVPIGAIIGGVVGGLVLIAVVVFLIIRHRRRTRPEEASSKKEGDNDDQQQLQQQQQQQ